MCRREQDTSAGAHPSGRQRNASEKPNRADVLAAVRPGRSVPIALTKEQKEALRAGDGRAAVDVVRHLLGARVAGSQRGAPPDEFPLTASVFQAVARRLGYVIGIKRSRSLLRRLVEAGVIERVGSYRQRYADVAGDSGYLVPLFRLGVAPAARKLKRPVGNGRRVKRPHKPRWWEHALFGDISGLPPPQFRLERAGQMRSVDELEGSWRRRR